MISVSVVAVAIADATVLVLPIKAHIELVVNLHGAGSNVLEMVSTVQAKVQFDCTREAEHKQMSRMSNETILFLFQTKRLHAREQLRLRHNQTLRVSPKVVVCMAVGEYHSCAPSM